MGCVREQPSRQVLSPHTGWARPAAARVVDLAAPRRSHLPCAPDRDTGACLMLPEGFRRLFRLPPSRARVERDVDDEIAFHLAMKEERLRASGLPPEEARAAARRRFGDVGRVADECRSIDTEHVRVRHRTEIMGSIWQDVRYAVRSLVRAPAFATAALLTLALGIGATTAVFSVVYGVLVRPLPYAQPERLVQLWETSTRTP